MAKRKKARLGKPVLVDRVQACLTIREGKAVLTLDRPTWNGFETAWLDALYASGITVSFNSACPLVICADPETGHAKYSPRQCSKECMALNSKVLSGFVPPWGKAEKVAPKT
jgi:hypothetical protein